MYRMFYDREKHGDILFILIEPERQATEIKKAGNVESMYDGEDLIGININNLSKILKIRAHGMIITPGEELVNVVNHIISRAGLKKLPYCVDSGYRVATITSIDEYVTLKVGEKTLTALKEYSNLEVGDDVVIALDGTIQYNRKTFKSYEENSKTINCHICIAEELRIESDVEGAFIVEGYKSGDDFYLAGE